MIGTPNADTVVFSKSSGTYEQIWPRQNQGTLTWEIDNGVNVWAYTPSGANGTYRYEASSGRLLSYRAPGEGDSMQITYVNGAPSTLSTRNWSATITTDPTTRRVTEIVIDQQPATRWIYHYTGDQLMRVALPSGENWRRYEYTSTRLSAVRDGAGKLLHTWTYDANGRAATGSDAVDVLTSIQYGLPGRKAGQSITRTTSGSGAITDHHLSFGTDQPRVVDATGASCSSCDGATTRAYNDRGTLICEQDTRGYISTFAYDPDERVVTVVQKNLRPADCDPASAPDHCRLTPETLTAVGLAATEATTTLRYEYRDPAWPAIPTDIFSSSVAQPSVETHDSALLDPETGRTMQTTRIGWTGDPLHEESRTSNTILYDGIEGAAFDPGAFFDRGWLTLPQPKSAVKRVDGSRTDVIDVADSVYYPEDASVPMVLRGHLAARRNAAGQITQWLAYDVWGNATQVADTNGVTTEFAFDGLGRPVDSTIKGVTGCNTTDDPLCATDLTTTNVYASPTGPLSEQHAAGGGVTAYQYDDRGRISSVSRGTSATDLRERIEYQYDPSTAKKTVERVLTNESGSWIEKKRETFGYDLQGRLSSITHADGTSSAYDYLACGLMSGQRDENHTTWNTTYEYDAGGRLAVVRQALATAPGGWIETRYRYDTAGNLIAVTDPNGNTTTYQYDDFGQMLRQTSPVTGVTTYAYDPAGNLLATTDANSATTARTYDALGRALTATSSKAGAPTESVTWTYDDAASGLFGIGRLASMTDPTGSTTSAYTRRGQLRTEAKTIRGATYTTGFGYDADGNRSRLVLPSGRVVDYGFDYAGRPITASTGATPLVTSATYLPFGPAAEIRYGNGTTRTSSYDARYRIETNALSGPAGPIASYDYDHDDVGNITAIRDVMDPGYDRGFGYDDINRLTTANSGAKLWGAGSYQYDAMGNMLSLSLGTHRTATFSYAGTTPKLSSVVEDGTPSSVSYDAVGNETAVGSMTSGYSARNHMTSYGSSTFAYDGRGIRTITTTVLDLGSVSVSAASITGGLPVTATIALTGAAPAGGSTVALTSDVSQLEPPTTVTIPAGETSITVEIATTPVVALTEAVLTATLDTTQRTAAVSILPAELSTFTVSPVSTTGGGSAEGVVTLTGPAAADGTVLLASGSPAAQVPASVPVPAGTSSVTVPVGTTPVAVDDVALLTATYGAISRDTSLQIFAPVVEALSLDASSAYGGTTVGGSVTLTGPSPAGGRNVAMSSTRPDVVAPPASLIVDPGTASKPFAVPVTPVDARTNVTITASSNGTDAAAAVLVVEPPVLTNVTVTPATLAGGETATVGAAINAPAPAAGSSIAVDTSEHAFAPVPPAIVIPAGGTAGQAPLATAPVASPTPVVVSGTLDGITRSATITLEPPPVTLAALTIAPAALVGSNDATGTVTLTDRAPALGIEIELFSSDPAAAVPATLLVPGGSIEAAFRVGTSVVTASTAVTITATHAVTSKTALVTLLPPAGNYVSSLSATPAFIAGGTSSTGTVTLALPSSDPGGSDVALTSDDPSLIVPSRVTVKRNTTSASFAIATNVVTVPRAVTLTASYGGVLQRTAVIVAPENAVTLASFTVTPSRVIGGTPANGTIVLTGPAPFGGALVSVTAKRRNMLTVPPTVPIPEGAMSAIFPIATDPVHGNKERLVEIGATYNGITRTATLALAPPPAASATRPVVRCASLALTPCLMSAALPPRALAPTSGIAQSRYNLYTPELTLLAETETTTLDAKSIAWEYMFFGAEPMAQIETATGEVHWYFTDHLGTPVVTTDSSGLVDWSVEREPYGLSVSTVGDRHQPLAFPGQEGDDANSSYNIFRWYSRARSRYTQADPLGKLGDPNAYAYALGNPIPNSDPLGLKVFRCCRDLQVNAVINGVAQVLGFKHCFIKTDSVEAGLGPANGGPLPACPLGVPTAITNHAGQSQQSGTTCTEISNVDEQCVNNALPIGKKMGPWTPGNNCNNFADDILKKCKQCRPKNEPFPTPFGPCAKLADGTTVCGGTGI